MFCDPPDRSKSHFLPGVFSEVYTHPMIPYTFRNDKYASVGLLQLSLSTAWNPPACLSFQETVVEKLPPLVKVSIEPLDYHFNGLQHSTSCWWTFKTLTRSLQVIFANARARVENLSRTWTKVTLYCAVWEKGAIALQNLNSGNFRPSRYSQ